MAEFDERGDGFASMPNEIGDPAMLGPGLACAGQSPRATAWFALAGAALITRRDRRDTLAGDDIAIVAPGGWLRVDAMGSRALVLGVVLPDRPEGWLDLCHREASGLRQRMADFAIACRRQDPRARSAAVEPLVPLLVQLEDRYGECVGRCPGRTASSRRKAFNRLHALRERIDASPESASLEALARFAGRSPCHLLRVYRRVFGESPTQHAIRVRLDRAYLLLESTNLPVNQVAKRFGENRCAFSRAFRERFGMTPSRVRARGANAVARTATASTRKQSLPAGTAATAADPP